MPADNEPAYDGANELETGIFSFAITWVQALAADLGDEKARGVVADYLDSLARTLRTLDEEGSNT